MGNYSVTPTWVEVDLGWGCGWAVTIYRNIKCGFVSYTNFGLSSINIGITDFTFVKNWWF